MQLARTIETEIVARDQIISSKNELNKVAFSDDERAIITECDREAQKCVVKSRDVLKSLHASQKAFNSLFAQHEPAVRQMCGFETDSPANDPEEFDEEDAGAGAGDAAPAPAPGGAMEAEPPAATA